jgi:hypothetical protein
MSFGFAKQERQANATCGEQTASELARDSLTELLSPGSAAYHGVLPQAKSVELLIA